MINSGYHVYHSKSLLFQVSKMTKHEFPLRDFEVFAKPCDEIRPVDTPNSGVESLWGRGTSLMDDVSIEITFCLVGNGGKIQSMQ